MAAIVITGCSRGLGLALTRQYASQQSTGLVFATGRSETPSDKLAKVISEAPQGRITYIQLDVDKTQSISRAAEAIKTYLSSSSNGLKGIDILINNAAIIFPEYTGVTTMKDIDLQAALYTNVISVHNVTNGFLPLLEAGAQKKIANVTSTLGSIGLIDQSQAAMLPSYKISKAALNMLTTQYAQELGPKGFTVFAVSPGWLKTDLGGWENAHLTAEEGAQRTADVIDAVNREKDNGQFKNIHVPGSEIYLGTNPPW